MIPNKINKGEHQDPYSAEELSKYIDPTWINNLAKNEVTEYEPISKQLTVVFWDISGFSDLCNRLEMFPTELAYFLNKYFNLAIEIIQKYHGILDKFIGDGILAFFGYDNRNEIDNGDPSDASDAATEFRTRFNEIKNIFVNRCDTKTGKDASKINLKCGIHTGTVFLYYFNSDNDKRKAIIQMGATINLASRLEDIANDNEIIVSTELRNKLKTTREFIEIKLEDRINKEHQAEFIKSFPEVKVVYRIP